MIEHSEKLEGQRWLLDSTSKDVALGKVFCFHCGVAKRVSKITMRMDKAMGTMKPNSVITGTGRSMLVIRNVS